MLLESDHGLYMGRHGGHGAGDVALGIGFPKLERLGVRQAVRHVALQGVVRRGLVGQDVGDDPGVQELVEEIDGVGLDGDRHRLPAVPRFERPGHPGADIGGDLV